MKTTQTNKYILFSVLTVLIFTYLLFTEVYGRMEESVSQYNQVTSKEKTLLTPEEFALRNRELQIEKQELTSWAKKNYFAMQQNQWGLFEYLNSNAKRNRVVVQSVNPQESKSSGSAKIIPFTLNFTAKYHDAVKFMNNIEMGTIPIIITKSTLQSEIIGHSTLTVSIEGQARLLSEL